MCHWADVRLSSTAPCPPGSPQAAQEEGPRRVPGASAGPRLPGESGARSPPAPYVEGTVYMQARVAGSSHNQTGTGQVSMWPVHWVRGPQDPRRVKLLSEQPACGDGTSHRLFPARLGGGVGPPAAHVPGVTGLCSSGPWGHLGMEHPPSHQPHFSFLWEARPAGVGGRETPETSERKKGRPPP